MGAWARVVRPTVVTREDALAGAARDLPVDPSVGYARNASLRRAKRKMRKITIFQVARQNS